MGEPEPVSLPVASAAAVVPSPVESVDGLVPVVVVSVLGDVLVLPPAVVDGFAPDVVVDELAGEPGVEPAEALELLGRAGVVIAGFGFGVVLDGLLDEDDGLGFGRGDGWGAAAGGALLGAPPEPKANPMTLPAGGL